MIYNKMISLKDGRTCLLRNGSEPDGQALLNIYLLTHAQTDYPLGHAVAQIAGIMGSKRTPDLIPMCHPIITDATKVILKLNEEDQSVDIESTVTCTGRTGVEMEAICACSVAAMTVYDMCKAVQRDIEITDIKLLSKSGGIHGDYNRQ